MTRATLRPTLNDIIGRSERKYRPVQLNLPHIFWALLRGGECHHPQFRPHMLFAFSMVEKLVKAAQHYDLPACMVWAREIDVMGPIWAAECGCFVDPLLLPAQALLNARQGDYAGARAKLLQSVAVLESLFEAGLAPAGIAALEQRLNLFRTAILANREIEQQTELKDLIAALQRHLEVSDRPVNGIRPSVVGEEVVLYYVDEIVFKIASVSGRAFAVDALNMLAASFDRVGAGAGIGWAAALAAALIAEDSALIGDLVTPDAPVLTAPASMMLMFDAILPRNVMGPKPDRLSLSVADHPCRERFVRTMAHTGLCPA